MMNLQRLVQSHLLLMLMFCLNAEVSIAAQSANSPYGAYTLYPQGSGRVMSMGGVYAALSDDATSVVFNPSGAALEKWSFDAGGTNNRVDDGTTPPASSSFSKTQSLRSMPFSYLFYSAAGRLGPVAIGGGYSLPYEFNYDDTSTFTRRNAKMSVSSYDLMLALALGDSFSIGASGHLRTLAQRLETTGTATAGVSEQTSYSNTYSFGASFRIKKVGFGVAYHPGQTFDVDTSKNRANETPFFRDLVIPDKITYGGFVRLTDRFLIALDMNQFSIPANAVDILSSVNTYRANDVGLQTGNIQVVHAGFEWVLAADKKMNLTFRGGGYYEPSRFLEGDARFHRTFGVQVQFGPALLNVSFDQAENFSNTSQGFSVVLGAI